MELLDKVASVVLLIGIGSVVLTEAYRETHKGWRIFMKVVGYLTIGIAILRLLF